MIIMIIILIIIKSKKKFPKIKNDKDLKVGMI